MMKMEIKKDWQKTVLDTKEKIILFSLCIIFCLGFLMFNSTSCFAAGININGNTKFKTNTCRLAVSGDVNVASNGEIQTTSGRISLTGDWINNGVYTPGTGIVEFNGTAGIQSINLAGLGLSKPFYRLEHTSGSTLQPQLAPATPLVINGNMINSNGTFDINGLDIFLKGNWENSAAFINSALVTCNGSGSQSITSGASPFNNFTVTNASVAGVSFLDAFTCNNFVDITPNSALSFKENLTHTINNTLTLHGQAAGTRININSINHNGVDRFDFNVPSGYQVANFVNVANSNALNNDIYAFGSINSGNNDDADPGISPRWVFDAGQRYWIGAPNGAWNNDAYWSLKSGGPSGIPGVTFPGVDNRAFFTGDDNDNCLLTAPVSVKSITLEGLADLYGAYSGVLNADVFNINTVETLNVRGGELRLPAGGSLTANGNIVVDGGLLNAVNGAIDANESVSIISGILQAPSAVMTVAKDFSHTGGTFAANNGKVTLDTTATSILSGVTAFYDLESTAGNKQITFTDGLTNEITVTNGLTLTGTSGNLLKIRSTTPGQWGYLTLQTGGAQTLNYLDVKDNNAGNGLTLNAGPRSTDSGHNVNWTFKIISLNLRDAGDLADYVTWNVAGGLMVNPGSDNIMNAGEAVLVKNDGNVPEDFGLSATAGSWALSSDGSIGLDIAATRALFNAAVVPVTADFNNGYDIVYTATRWASTSAGSGNFEGLASGANVDAGIGPLQGPNNSQLMYIGLKIPADVNPGHENETITVTVKAMEHQ